MVTEEQSPEQKQEETPVYTFKESAPVENDNFTPISDVVQIPEEVEDKTTTEEKEEKKEEEKQEGAAEEKKEGSDSEEQEEEEPVYDLDEELSFNFLKEKYDLKYDSVEDFLKSKEGKKDPEFEKFQEYKAKTGRSYGDFLQTQKDWSQENPDTIIKSLLKIENPDLSSEDIDFLFDRDYGFDEETDDEFDIKSKKINLKVDAKKALSILEKQKEDYNVPRGSEDDNVPEVYKEAKDLIDKLYDEQVENEESSKILRNDFVSKMQSTLTDKFDGFEFTIDGQEFKVKPDDIKKTREDLLDIANFQKTFFDKSNKLSDPKGYGKALYGAMNIDKIAQHFYNLGKTSYAEQLEKESKNIDVKGEKHIPEPVLSGFTFKKA
jgi:hypothetical protein